MNKDKYLLFWILKAIDSLTEDGLTPEKTLSETFWKDLGAHDWVLPAIQDAITRFELD